MVKCDKGFVEIKFTFHYVSIKSSFAQMNEQYIYKFTFHYVSIKSVYFYRN